MDRVITFHLSDDDETLNLPEVFLSYGPHINPFIHLRSLVIDYTHYFDLLKQTTFECREILYLTHLRIHINDYQDPEDNFWEFINNIWSIPKLNHGHLNIIHLYAARPIKMSTISQSIKYLSTTSVSYNHDKLSHVFNHTPHLKRFDAGTFYQYRDPQSQIIFPSLISLGMDSCNSVDWMKNLFKKVSFYQY